MCGCGCGGFCGCRTSIQAPKPMDRMNCSAYPDHVLARFKKPFKRYAQYPRKREIKMRKLRERTQPMAESLTCRVLLLSRVYWLTVDGGSAWAKLPLKKAITI